MCLPLVYIFTFVKNTYLVFFLSKANRHSSKDRARADPALEMGKIGVLASHVFTKFQSMQGCNGGTLIIPRMFQLVQSLLHTLESLGEKKRINKSKPNNYFVWCLLKHAGGASGTSEIWLPWVPRRNFSLLIQRVSELTQTSKRLYPFPLFCRPETVYTMSPNDPNLQHFSKSLCLCTLELYSGRVGGVRCRAATWHQFTWEKAA